MNKIIIKILIVLVSMVTSPCVLSASAEVTWTPPIQREDGTPLVAGEIRGYNVYYGTEAGNYMYRLPFVDDPETGTTIDLLQGTYYLVVTTVDTAGRESRFSEEYILILTAPTSLPNTVQEFLLYIGFY